jgi:hypothetical protein
MITIIIVIHFTGYLVISSRDLKIPLRDVKPYAHSIDLKFPLRDVKPYAPGFFGSHPASIPVDKNNQLSVSFIINFGVFVFRKKKEEFLWRKKNSFFSIRMKKLIFSLHDLFFYNFIKFNALNL